MPMKRIPVFPKYFKFILLFYVILPFLAVLEILNVLGFSPEHHRVEVVGLFFFYLITGLSLFTYLSRRTIEPKT